MARRGKIPDDDRQVPLTRSTTLKTLHRSSGSSALHCRPPGLARLYYCESANSRWPPRQPQTRQARIVRQRTGSAGFDGANRGFARDLRHSSFCLLPTRVFDLHSSLVTHHPHLLHEFDSAPAPAPHLVPHTRSEVWLAIALCSLPCFDLQSSTCCARQ